MIVLGLILLILGWIIGIGLLVKIGMVVIIIGLVLLVLGYFHPAGIAGRRYWY